jgi:hypothetical protein
MPEFHDCLNGYGMDSDLQKQKIKQANIYPKRANYHSTISHSTIVIVGYITAKCK